MCIVTMLMSSMCSTMGWLVLPSADYTTKECVKSGSVCKEVPCFSAGRAPHKLASSFYSLLFAPWKTKDSLLRQIQASQVERRLAV